MIERQNYFKNANVGGDLKIENNVFNLIYLVELFNEFYPEKFSIKRGNRGRPTIYSPKELLTFYFWGKNNEKHSYRQLEKWYDNDDETCKLVLNCKNPSKTTINNFKNDYDDLIGKFDQFLIDLGLELGLIDGEILYGDGTILKAWCNTFKKMYPDEIQYLKKFIHKNVKNKKLWDKLQRYYATDESNKELKEELELILDKLHYNLNINGIHLLKLSLISSKNFEKVLERIELMEKNIDGENSISIIDPESRHMPDKKGKMGLNYNYQTVTDKKYGFRIAHYITNAPNDQKEAKRVVDLTSTRLHTDDYTICFDNGYWDEDLLKEIYRTNTRVVIPYKTDATRNKQKYKNKNKSDKRQKMEKQKKYL